MRPDVLLARIASRQHGLVTYQQALRTGLTARQIQLRNESGALIGVHRGIYRLASVAATSESSLLGACLATCGVASHRAAAVLWRLRGFESAKPEVTVIGKRWPGLRGVVGHTTDRLADVDVTRRWLIPVTSVARTLLDLGAVDPRSVEPATEDALVRRLVTVPSLWDVLARAGGRGRRGAGVLRDLLAARDPALAPTESPLEDAVVAVLRRHRQPEPARQYPVTLPNGRSARLDLCYPEAMLVIECNGMRWHSSTADLRRDQSRANMLTALGWVVLCFTWADLRDERRLVEQVATVRLARSARRAG